MYALLKNNTVIYVANNFVYQEGVWEADTVRLGMYVDPNLQIVEAPPQTTVGQVYENGEFKTILPSIAERIYLSQKIDSDADYIYAAVQGNRGNEYVLAESESVAFKAANYQGTVPSSVASWASAKGNSAQWAADDILATAAAWRGAMSLIRANRLYYKEQAKVANNLANTATSWSIFVAFIKGQLGIL